MQISSNGDILVNFDGSSQTGQFKIADGSASSPALTFWADGSGDTGIFRSGANTVNFSTGGSERMRIDSSGRVGIGTSSPETLLHLKASSPRVILEDTGTDAKFRINADSSVGNVALDVDLNSDTSTPSFIVNIKGSEKMRIDSSGKVGIGTTSPVRNLHIKDTSPRIMLSNDNTGHASGDGTEILLDSGGNFEILQRENLNLEFFTNNLQRMTINGSGNVGIGTSSPAAPFHVYHATNNTIARLESGDATARLMLKDNSGEAFVEVIGDNLIFSNTSSVTERMRIDSSGRLLLGTTSPVMNESGFNEIVLAGKSEGAGIHLADDNNNVQAGMFTSDGGGGTFFIRTITNNPMAFRTNNTERMRIDSSGHILFGRTAVIDANRAAAGTLSIGGSASGTSECLVQLKHGSNTNSTSRNYMLIYNDAGTIVGSITANSTSTSYNTSSDYRLKENATAISDGIARIKTLKPYRFNFKADASTTLDGFFAHEVTAVPEAISGEKDAVKEDGSIDPQGIDQSKLVPLLVAAVQELIGKVEALEAA